MPYDIFVTQGQGGGPDPDQICDTLEDALAWVKDHTGDGSFAIRYPDGQWHRWNNWSGRTSLHGHKDENWRDYVITDNDRRGVHHVVMLDAQWSTCPVEVEQQVKDLWRAYELGNDHYIIKTSINDLLEVHSVEHPNDLIVQYLRENNVGEDEQVIIHWWW